MQFQDELTIRTPEGVDLTLQLAGVGSRFAAALVDLLLQLALVIAVTLLGAAAGGGYAGAITVTLATLVFVAYDVAFEVLASGRTPGKRLNGLRVVRVGGQPVGFVTSAIRNVLRLVDLLPSAYLVGIVSILVTRRNQRIGDLIAGTIVAREVIPEVPRLPLLITPPLYGDPDLDVTAVTPQELALVVQFLERRQATHPDARAQIARTLADRLRPKVGGAHEELPPEEFLLALVREKHG